MLEEIISILLAILCLGLSITHFLEKGMLLNNAWIFASQKERLTINKKPHYRQSAIIFLLLAIMFALFGISAMNSNVYFSIGGGIVGALALLYAIFSSINYK